MFKFLYLCLSRFGIYGLLIYFKFKFGSTKKIRVPGIAHPVGLRPGTADEYTFREIFITKEYDIATGIAHPKYIIDAGANIGLTSIFFACLYPSATIISIEPDTGNFNQLLLNVKPYSNIIPLNAALWNSDESVRVTDQGFGIRGYVVEKASEGDSIGAITIENIMRIYDFPNIDILKMDIEGSEREVLETGYESWLPKVRCFVVELHDRMKPGCSKAVFSAVVQYDFSFSIKGENLVFTNRSMAAAPEN
jgi:FkbM family methyltransferase